MWTPGTIQTVLSSHQHQAGRIRGMARNDRYVKPEPGRKEWVLWLTGIVILAGAAAFWYYQRESAKVETQMLPAARPLEEPSAPVAESEPEPRYPIPETPVPPLETAPLPSLNDSDTAMRDALVRLFGEGSVNQFLVPANIVINIVATIDNLPREKAAVRLWPVSQTRGEFLTAGQEGSITLSPANHSRYTPFIRLVAAADAGAVAAVYLRFYPLFQAAYENLGNPSRYFNDRLIEVIDHLLAAPDVRGAVKLVRPGVYYKFADPGLEARSAGQKVLIRMGGENAAVIKGKLRELRGQVSAVSR